MAAGANGERTLEETPTWAVAAVCAFIVIISVVIEHGIHSLAEWFQKKNKKAMLEALEKIKAELMLLGFISLLLTVSQQQIAKICIPSQAGKILLPCKKAATGYPKDGSNSSGDDKNDRRKLLWYGGDLIWHRALAAAAGDGDYCAKHGDKVSLITQYALHQLHIFIFVLAVFHVLYSVITMVLAQAKMKKWEKWEQETTSLEYQFANDPARFRFTHQTSFVKRHAGLSQTPGIRWIVAFFRQFFRSVTKVDYLTMRHGFINAHLAPNSKFDFHKYMKRALEDDFKVVVGISIPLWFFAIIFMLVNVYAWYTLFWISFIPLVIILLVGMKLEVVIMQMAHQIENRTAVVKGVPIVEPSNRLFWFNRPEWILYLIHFTLFQNAFQMAFFLWVWYEFGLTSCFHDNLGISLARVFLGLVLQFLCSYITFPLYALVTQMGSHMKKAIFEEQTAKALMKWRKQAKERKKKLQKAGVDPSSGFISSENTPSHSTSPLHLLHNHKAHSADLESVPNSPRSYQSDTDLSEPDSSIHGPHGNYTPTRHDQSLPGNGEDYSQDFSFSKMAKP